ncbi:hypothetical protein B0H16DRAFT_1340950, partial [Mycena metata]
MATPPRLATKQEILEFSSPFRPSVKRKYGPAAGADPAAPIDIVSPPRTKPKLELHAPPDRGALPPSNPGPPQREVQTALGPIQVGNQYDTVDDGIAAVFDWQAALGYKWILAQSHKNENGVLRKRVVRCNRYRDPTQTHDMDIDPADHQQGRSGRTGCKAHVNLCLMSGPLQRYYISVVDAAHNHDPPIPPGGQVPRPPTEQQRAVVARFADNFSRKQIQQILDSESPDNNLEPRQISNMRNRARKEAHEEIEALGGDLAAI